MGDTIGRVVKVIKIHFTKLTMSYECIEVEIPVRTFFWILVKTLKKVGNWMEFEIKGTISFSLATKHL